ncbi:Zinc finger, C2H2 [Penicillium italicum]|uniref:Zinc finger, C2H2 n=1 Tax=Penicillium italicum TaxID=40296 RepID=A0A0A2KXF0_PENIT|nr:Zinc finger, C2H2 [Penicillium italicum]
MASPPCDAHFDYSQEPDGHDLTPRDFKYFQSTPLACQSSASILADPSIACADPLRYTYHIQYPTPSVAPSFAVSSASTSTCSDLCHFNHRFGYQSLIENNGAATAPEGRATGHLGPRHDMACTNVPASTSFAQRTSLVKASSNSHANGKRASGRNQGRQQKQKTRQQSFKCHWNDCTYRNAFSGKPALMRHIDTQHVSPRSFDCPSCAMSFNRKDNLTEHLGRVHWERVES